MTVYDRTEVKGWFSGVWYHDVEHRGAIVSVFSEKSEISNVAHSRHEILIPLSHCVQVTGTITAGGFFEACELSTSHCIKRVTKGKLSPKGSYICLHCSMEA